MFAKFPNKKCIDDGKIEAKLLDFNLQFIK